MAPRQDTTLAPVPPRSVTRRPEFAKIAEVIAASIRKQIARGELRPGEHLPLETEMTETYGVSRPTLREAFRILESQSLIELRRGSRSGAVVLGPNPSVVALYGSLILQTQGTTIADLYRARTLIEPPAVRLVIERSDSGSVAKLDAAADHLQTLLGEPDEFAMMANGFHRLLIDEAGNKTLSMIASMLNEINERHVRAEMARRVGSADERTQNERALKSFRRLVRLIDAGDGDAAELFWRKHMDAAGELLVERLGAKNIIDILE